MTVRVAMAIMMIWGTVQGSARGAGNYPDPSHPLVQGLLSFRTAQQYVSQAQDSLSDIDVTSPYYRYPGKAMMMSLALPGAGQLYVGRRGKALAFLGVEVAAVLVWKRYFDLGEQETEDFRLFADEYWDFRDWVFNASHFQGGEWDSIKVGIDGSHHLNYYVNLDGGSRVFGNTKDDADKFIQYLNNPSTKDSVYIINNRDYYENIGKYDQFFSGWDDADPSDPNIEKTTTGFIAHSDNRDTYLSMRGTANRLKSMAGYAVSVLMFNHVVSAIDAIFTTSEWNSDHARRLSGHLWFNPASSHGVGGLQISLAW